MKTGTENLPKVEVADMMDIRDIEQTNLMMETDLLIWS